MLLFIAKQICLYLLTDQNIHHHYDHFHLNHTPYYIATSSHQCIYTLQLSQSFYTLQHRIVVFTLFGDRMDLQHYFWIAIHVVWIFMTIKFVIIDLYDRFNAFFPRFQLNMHIFPFSLIGSVVSLSSSTQPPFRC